MENWVDMYNGVFQLTIWVHSRSNNYKKNKNPENLSIQVKINA